MKIQPQIFIASSSGKQSMEIAETLKNLLEPLADVYCWWDERVFRNGSITLSVLMKFAATSDIGIFIFNSDDKVFINDKGFTSTRDNVLFEYGLFVDRIGTSKSFIVKPSGLENFRLPSDLSGLTHVQFEPGPDLTKALQTVYSKIKHEIELWKKEDLKRYFKNFEAKEEPELIVNHNIDQSIDYNRSFNLLLYMFGNEKFSQFRALDLAFCRWEEAFQDKKKAPSQIVNYSKDIIESVKGLYKRGNCNDFRRILVIPIQMVISPESLQVLRLIQSSERESLMHNPNGIIETKILCYNNNFNYELSQYNDFALFTSENEDFAIVETTLKSPQIIAPPGNCVIVTNKEKLNHRKDFFDWLWEHEVITINEYIKRHHHKDISHTISDAYDLLYNSSHSTDNKIEEVSIIIETAYVELIRVGDEKRIAPVERAFDLLNQISVIPKFRGNIFLDAFINDFRPKTMQEIECAESCEVGDISINANFQKLKVEITEHFKALNSSKMIDDDSIGTFYMTKTRAKASNTLRKLKKDTPTMFTYELQPNGNKEIYLKVKEKRAAINLGYEKDDNIIPNCAMLMAQHYNDLFQFIDSPNRKNFWIFDFLIYSEKKSVELGAHALKYLFKWRPGIDLHIVNCTYDEDGSGDMQHTHIIKS